TFFSESFRLVNSSPGKFNIKFRESGTLEKRIKDTEFFIEIIRNKCLFINNNRIDIDVFDQEEEEMKNAFADRLKELKEIQETFIKLNITLSGDFSNYDKDIRKILIFRYIILKRNDYSHVTKTDYHIHTLGRYKN